LKFHILRCGPRRGTSSNEAAASDAKLTVIVKAAPRPHSAFAVNHHHVCVVEACPENFNLDPF